MNNNLQVNKFNSMIEKIINSNSLSHAYLIEVNDVSEDMKYVFNFIKLILCKENKSLDCLNCNKCNICKQIDDNNYIDLKIIEADGSNIKKKQMIDLQNDFKNKSFLNNKMIYVIKDADKLNTSSSNTILKFLEEPEDDIIAILISTNRYNVIETILSRCQILSLSSNRFDIDYDDNTILLLESIIKEDLLFINYKKIQNSLFTDKDACKKYLFNVQNILVSYINYRNEVIDQFPNELISILNKKNLSNYIYYVDIIEEEIKKLSYNVNFKLWMDSLFSKLIGR